MSSDEFMDLDELFLDMDTINKEKDDFFENLNKKIEAHNKYVHELETKNKQSIKNEDISEQNCKKLEARCTYLTDGITLQNTKFKKTINDYKKQLEIASANLVLKQDHVLKRKFDE